MRTLLLRYNAILAPVQFPSPRSVSPSHRGVYGTRRAGKGGVSGAAELQARPLKRRRDEDHFLRAAVRSS